MDIVSSPGYSLVIPYGVDTYNMAVIYEKYAPSGDNCLILGLKEALVYPFDVGDWNQLRVAVAYSLTTPNTPGELNNNNELVTSSDISVNTDGSAQTCMFFGLTNAFGINNLGNSGYNFVGIGTPPNPGWGVRSASASIQMVSTQRTNSLVAFTTIGSGWQHDPTNMNSTTAFSSLNPPYFTLPSSLMTGDETYAGVYSLRFYRNNPNQAFENFQLESYTIYNIPNTTPEYLQLANSQSSTATHTGLRWNYERNIDGGNPLPTPNNFIFYSPFTSDYRFRIHSILIEKYA